MAKKLSNREQVFCESYLGNGYNGMQAAITAGYSNKGDSAKVIACKLLKEPKIKAYIDSKISKQTEKMGATFEWKIQKLIDCINCAMVEQKGKPVLVNSKALLGAIAELNKMQGHYSAEKIVTTNINADTDVKDAKDLTEQYRRPY